MRLLSQLLLALWLPLPALAAAPVDHAAQYRACLSLLRQAPWEAYESARAWEPLGGGDAARHCAALSLIELKQYDAAALELEEIAQSQQERGEVSPAAVLGQAANAWFLAGRLDRAETAVISALERAPDDAGLLIDWARILGEAGRYAEALDALDRALVAVPDDAEVWAFKAAALRHLDRVDDARAAVDKALALEPGHPNALLERGLLRRAKGDDDGAREDWLALTLAWEGTPAGDAARAYLEEMDVQSE
ncbi:MAG: tetratricopeptide repeat protein [Alphaproteobacteria bacterium]